MTVPIVNPIVPAVTPVVVPPVPPVVPEVPVVVPPVTDPPADDMASLPEWAQKQIKDLRTENADRRTRTATAEAALKAAKTPEEFETARNEWVTANTDVERALAALTYGLPDRLAARLVGTTREELMADAKALQADMNDPSNAGPLSGGLTPASDDDGESDPLALAKRANRTRLF